MSCISARREGLYITANYNDLAPTIVTVISVVGLQQKLLEIHTLCMKLTKNEVAIVIWVFGAQFEHMLETLETEEYRWGVYEFCHLRVRLAEDETSECGPVQGKS